MLFSPHDIFPEGNMLNQVLRRIDFIKECKIPDRDEIYENNIINEIVDDIPL